MIYEIILFGSSIHFINFNISPSPGAQDSDSESAPEAKRESLENGNAADAGDQQEAQEVEEEEKAKSAENDNNEEAIDEEKLLEEEVRRWKKVFW